MDDIKNNLVELLKEKIPDKEKYELSNLETYVEFDFDEKRHKVAMLPNEDGDYSLASDIITLEPKAETAVAKEDKEPINSSNSNEKTEISVESSDPVLTDEAKKPQVEIEVEKGTMPKADHEKLMADKDKEIGEMKAMYEKKMADMEARMPKEEDKKEDVTKQPSSESMENSKSGQPKAEDSDGVKPNEKSIQDVANEASFYGSKFAHFKSNYML